MITINGFLYLIITKVISNLLKINIIKFTKNFYRTAIALILRVKWLN
jgi:hypothetical protein